MLFYNFLLASFSTGQSKRQEPKEGGVDNTIYSGSEHETCQLSQFLLHVNWLVHQRKPSDSCQKGGKKLSILLAVYTVAGYQYFNNIIYFFFPCSRSGKRGHTVGTSSQMKLKLWFLLINNSNEAVTNTLFPQGKFSLVGPSFLHNSYWTYWRNTTAALLKANMGSKDVHKSGLFSII